jgi:hypothetical protein
MASTAESEAKPRSAVLPESADRRLPAIAVCVWALSIVSHISCFDRAVAF